jgi:hypothetical protein
LPLREGELDCTVHGDGSRGEVRQGGRHGGVASWNVFMEFPDLAPWLDSVADEYHELPTGDHETPYDE